MGMVEIRTRVELEDYIGSHVLRKTMEREFGTAMRNIEDCRNGGASDALLVIEDDEQGEILDKYMSLTEPEIIRTITDENEIWKEYVFVLGDAGGGVVLFQKHSENAETLPRGNENAVDKA